MRPDAEQKLFEFRRVRRSFDVYHVTVGGTCPGLRDVLPPDRRVAARRRVEARSSVPSRAHEICFIASSVAFDVKHEPTIVVAKHAEPRA
jgi:hypothetical protein